MPFTTDELLDISTILEITPRTLDDHLEVFIPTAAIEAKVITQIDRYNDGTVSGGVWFEGTESNEGFNMSTPNTASTKDPKTIIALLLEFDLSSQFSGQTRLIRAA